MLHFSAPVKARIAEVRAAVSGQRRLFSDGMPLSLGRGIAGNQNLLQGFGPMHWRHVRPAAAADRRASWRKVYYCGCLSAARGLRCPAVRPLR